jgi:hypothetical protein
LGHFNELYIEMNFLTPHGKEANFRGALFVFVIASAVTSYPQGGGKGRENLGDWGEEIKNDIIRCSVLLAILIRRDLFLRFR